MKGVLWPTSRVRRIVLFAIVAAAAIVRLGLWLAFPDHQPANDEVEYLQVARDLLAGKGWQFYDTYPWLRAPLYSIWLAGSLWLMGGDAHLATLPNLALGVGQVWLVFGLARGLLQPDDRAEDAGLWAAGVMAILLTFVSFANLWMSEILWGTLWMLTLLYLLLWRTDRKKSYVILSGVFLGFTILTRSVPLMFAPVLIGWMIWVARKKALVPLLLFGISCTLMIAPWTVRNWRAYGTPIMVETGFSYNVWAFSEPALELDEINQILSDIPNPVDRAAYASEQGQTLLAADPWIIARKPWPNMIYLWRIKPIEDRFLQQHYFSDVPLVYFISALIFDDLLYVILLGSALWGLAHAKRDARLALVILWLGYVVATTMLTHGEPRYRHFFWPLLMVYAGATLARIRGSSPWWQRFPLAMAGAVIMFIIVSQYPWAWVQENVERGWYRQQSVAALKAGDFVRAEQAAERGIALAPSSDSWIQLGYIRELRGDIDGAETALRKAVDDYQTYPIAALELGEFWLRHGTLDQARDAWNPPYNSDQVLQEFAWRMQIQPVTNTIDLGNGLDRGLVSGVYPAEMFDTTPIRWTTAKTQLRLPAGPQQHLQLRVRDPRPIAAETRFCVAQTCSIAMLSAEWRVLDMLVPASPTERLLIITTPPWQPKELNLGSDTRNLGIMLDWVQLEKPFIPIPER